MIKGFNLTLKLDKSIYPVIDNAKVSLSAAELYKGQFGWCFR